MATCFWCEKDCGGTCLGVNHPGGPRQMKPTDPAYWMLSDGHTSTKEVHRDGCYICEDVEYAAMGLPLLGIFPGRWSESFFCQPCPDCSIKAGEKAGHIPADDTTCEDCGYDAYAAHVAEKERQSKGTG